MQADKSVQYPGAAYLLAYSIAAAKNHAVLISY